MNERITGERGNSNQIMDLTGGETDALCRGAVCHLGELATTPARGSPENPVPSHLAHKDLFSQLVISLHAHRQGHTLHR